VSVRQAALIGPGLSLRQLAIFVLGWLVIGCAIARVQLPEIAVAGGAPAQALRFDRGNARALTGLAESLQLKGLQQQVIPLSRAALEREPMNVVALRTLGTALEQTGQQVPATRLMLLGAELGWRDVPLQLWLMKAYALQGDHRAVLRRADALARMERLPQVTTPVFLVYLTDDDLRFALAQELADRPPWRGNFFYSLLQLPAEQMPYVTSLIEDLAKIGSPVTPAERDIYLARLVQLGQAGPAYDYWLRDQKVAAGGGPTLSWDPGFDHVPPPGAEVAPFEWQLAPESVGVGSIESGDGGPHLLVSPGRDYTGRLISQTIALQPGGYRLTASVKGDAAAAGLRWAVRCVPGDQELPLDAGPSGAEFGTIAFQVPAQVCPAQTLEIDAQSDGGAANGVSIDNVNIQRAN
jgi:hypothetical protein